MSGYSASEGNRWFEFEALPIQTVTLEQYQIDQAIDLSDRVVTEAQQWRTYLNALALFGFKQWLSETAPDLTLNWKHSSVVQPQYANVLDAVCHLTAGEFKLCLIAAGTNDPFIQVPRSAIDLAEYAAHFYVIVRVLEEQEQACVWSFLRYDQWIAHQQAHPLQPERNWSYQVPAEWFDRDLNHLLLHLRCLDPEAIRLPQTSAIHPGNWSSLQNQVTKQLSQPGAREAPLWQLLTWEQGEAILRNPSLLEWLYHLHSGNPAIASQPVEDTRSLLQPLLDVGRWLNNELDEMTQSLGWILLPQFAMRSTRDEDTLGLRFSESQPTPKEINLIRKNLAQDGIAIPAEARWVYKDLDLAEVPLRLHAIVWLIRDTADRPDEWSLLLVLNGRNSDLSSHRITLCVKDQTELLVKLALEPDGNANYVYTRLVGSWDDAFLVTIALENGMTVTLPAFTFHRT